MKTAFCSGSMNLLTAVSTGNYCLIPTNTAVADYYGPGYLGHLYNSKQHLQFVRFIKGVADLPAEHLPRFLNAYAGQKEDRAGLFEPVELCVEKLAKIRAEFMKQQVYIFEITSLYVYEEGDLQVMHELVEGVVPRKQDREELEADIAALLAELPADAKVVFVGPIRAAATTAATADAEDADVIHSVLNAVAESSKNTIKIYDPTLIIRKGGEQVYKDGKYTTMGRGLYFIMLYETCLSKFN